MGVLLVMVAVRAAAEPTELEKERQELLDMGIDPAILAGLEASAKQTQELMAMAKLLDERVLALQRALLARHEVVACQADAVKRVGGPVTGSVHWSMTVSPAGAVTDAKVTKREGNVDDVLVSCVAAILRTLTEAPRTEAWTVEVPLTFPFAVVGP